MRLGLFALHIAGNWHEGPFTSTTERDGSLHITGLFRKGCAVESRLETLLEGCFHFGLLQMQILLGRDD